MSSLAATQADGYYVPVAYFDSGAYQKQSKNQWNACQAKNNQSSKKGHNQYEQRSIVRFELPNDGICLGCQAHIKRGTRFNAHKAAVGAYHSTPIYEFRTKCRTCQREEFVVRTDPAAFGFQYVSGIRKQQRDFEAAPEDSCLVLEEADASQALTGAELLERRIERQKRQLTDLEQIQQLQKLQTRQLNDADHNSHLRSRFRVDRRKRHRQMAGGAALGWRPGMALLEDSNVDEEAASKTAVFGPDGRTKERQQWRTLNTASIFRSEGSRRRISHATRKRSRAEAAGTNSDCQPDPVTSNPSVGLRRSRRKQAVDTIDVTEAEAQPCADSAPKPRRRIVPVMTSSKGLKIATRAESSNFLSSSVEIASSPAGALEALANYESSSAEDD